MFVKWTMNKVMALQGGSPAVHIMGNIGRKNDEYVQVYAEKDDKYIGRFEEGFGFMDVEFDKSDCRNLTQEEIDLLNTKVISINGQIYPRCKLDGEGNFINKNN